MNLSKGVEYQKQTDVPDWILERHPIRIHIRYRYRANELKFRKIVI